MLRACSVSRPRQAMTQGLTERIRSQQAASLVDIRAGARARVVKIGARRFVWLPRS